jgi:hypothetical protein
MPTVGKGTSMPVGRAPRVSGDLDERQIEKMTEELCVATQRRIRLGCSLALHD